MLCAKFDGNLLATFRVIVKKLLAYFLWTWCSNKKKTKKKENKQRA